MCSAKFARFFQALVFVCILSCVKPAFAQGSADIVIMIDLTGSTSVSDLALEKSAAHTLLQSFDNLAVHPRVAIGTFNEPNGNSLNPARIVSGGELSQDYVKLNQVIDGITLNGGFTDIAAAINVAEAHLDLSGQSSNRYIILISDGTPNRPGQGDYNNCDNCGCADAYSAASIARQNAESHGTKIFAIHYAGSALSASFCVYEPLRGQTFMHDQIATNDSYFYQGNADLSGVFNKVSCSISCEDNDPCTVDSCDQNGICQHTPMTTDTDGDGVLDCHDQCRGVDALLNTPCSEQIGGCPGAGVYACNSQGNVSCKLDAPSAQNCFNCTSQDQSPVLTNVSVIFKTQKSIVDKLIKSVSKLSRRNAKVQKEVKSIKAKAKSLVASSSQAVQVVPAVFLQCSNLQRCTNVYESSRIANLSTSLSSFKGLSDKLYSRLRKLTRSVTKADKALKTKAGKTFQAGKKVILSIPQTRSECS